MLLAKEIKIYNKYSDFLNISLEKKALMLVEITKLNQYTIELDKSQQLFYRLIYSLGLVKFKTLKTYIKINLNNSFI